MIESLFNPKTDFISGSDRNLTIGLGDLAMERSVYRIDG